MNIAETVDAKQENSLRKIAINTFQERKCMVELICEFCSEHWPILYGLLMFGIGEICGYIKGRKERTWTNPIDKYQ